MQFYRVLIVDDEPYIVHCLADLLAAQSDMNLDICQAYSADEALRHLERQRIDILMSDIEMPGMLGLALIRTVRDRWPACKTLLVTAHPDFQYVYEAFQLGIVSYILKTETDAHIVAEVKKAIGLIEEELNKTELIAENSEDMRSALNIARRELFFSLLDGRNNSEEEGTRTVRALGFHVPIGSVYLLSGRVLDAPGPGDPDRPRALAKAFYAARMIMSHYITSGLTACCETRQDRIYWMVQSGPSGAHEPFAPWLHGMLETVQQSCRATADIRLSFVVSPVITSLAQLAVAYRRGDMLLHRLGVQPADFIYTAGAEDTPDAVNTGLHTSRETCCAQLRFLWETEQFCEFMAFMDTACAPLHKGADWYDLAALEQYYALALLLLSLIDRRGLRQQIEKQVRLEPLFHPYIQDSWSVAAGYLKKLAALLLESADDDKEDISRQTIRHTKEYINAHITEDISLQRLSEVTGYNLSYLSRFFSEKTGEKLTQYIAKRKLECIQALMRNPELSLTDIAEQAGFKTRSYFNRFIKRVAGMTPQKLREEQIK
jgi:two-component system response regulator YesN